MNDAILHAPFVRRITKNLTAEEERLIAAAEMPLREPVSDELLWETRAKFEQNRKVLIQGVAIAFGVAGAGLLLGATKYSIAVIVTAVIFAVAAVIVHLCTKIDETATMMSIPLDHIDSSLTGSFAVCYLPDGKYELRVTGDNSYANTIVVIQYKRLTTWQAVFVRKGDALMPSTLDIEPEDSAETEASSAAEQPGDAAE